MILTDNSDGPTVWVGATCPVQAPAVYRRYKTTVCWVSGRALSPSQTDDKCSLSHNVLFKLVAQNQGVDNEWAKLQEKDHYTNFQTESQHVLHLKPLSQLFTNRIKKKLDYLSWLHSLSSQSTSAWYDEVTSPLCVPSLKWGFFIVTEADVHSCKVNDTFVCLFRVLCKLVIAALQSWRDKIKSN